MNYFYNVKVYEQDDELKLVYVQSGIYGGSMHRRDLIMEDIKMQEKIKFKNTTQYKENVEYIINVSCLNPLN